MNTDSADAFASPLIDILRVHFINIAAIGLSMTELEKCLRIASILAALIYTICKIIQSVWDIRNKAKEPSQIDTDVK